jgi:chromosome segregation ATPase
LSRKNLFSFSIDAEKLKSWSNRLTTLHRIFEEQKRQVENSVEYQLRKEFTTAVDQLRNEIKHLKRQLESAEATKEKLQAKLKTSYALIQSKEECIEEAHTIHRYLEREALVSKEAKQHVEHLYRKFQREKVRLEEVNQHLQKENSQLKQANGQHQEEKLRLETALQKCEKKSHMLQRIIDNNSTQLLSLREQNTKLLREVDRKGGHVRSLETSNEALRGELAAEKNVRSELLKASREQQVKAHNDQDEQLKKARQSRNKYQKKVLALENEVKALKLDTALAKTNEDELNGRIRQLREAAVIVHEELATEKIAVFELTKDNEELNETVLAMKSSLGSLAGQWGVGLRSSPPMSVSNKDNIQTTPVTPSRRQSSMSSSSNNIQGTPAAQSKQLLMSENNNSNDAIPPRSRSRNTTALVERPPRPPTVRERAHKNLDKLPLQLLQEFNDAMRKADTMVPTEGFHLVKPYIVGPVSANSI